MFNIFNNNGEVVDTATNLFSAQQIVTALHMSDRDNAPFHTAPAAA